MSCKFVREEVNIMLKKIVTLSAFFVFMLSVFVAPASADTVSVNFENPPYNLGSIHNQDGWQSSGSAGQGCAPYDHKVSAQTAYPAFAAQSLRISNAVTSGCFSDNTFAKPLVNAVGEIDSTAGSFPTGTLASHFDAQFSIGTTTPNAQQSGLSMSVSPDRGDGSRMSYLRFEDSPSGINVFFVDVQGNSDPVNFVETPIASGLSRSVPHQIRFVVDLVNGPSNDTVRIYIDGNLAHRGTTWENYYRFDPESASEQSPRIIRTLLFRTGGTAVPANAGKGFLIDNLSLNSAETAPAAPTNVNGNVTVNNPYNMNINWTDNAINETRYEVRYVSGRPTNIATLPANTTSWTLPNVGPHTSYSFEVRACNNAGCSAFSSPITLSTP